MTAPDTWYWTTSPPAPSRSSAPSPAPGPTVEADPPWTGSLPTRQLPTRRSLREADVPSSGQVVARHRLEASLAPVRPGRPQRPRRVRAVQVGSLAAVVVVGVALVGLAGQGHGTVVTVSDGQTLRGSREATLGGLGSADLARAGSGARSPTANAVAAPSGAASARVVASAGPAHAVALSAARTNRPGGTMAVRMYGQPRSGLPWHSGFWLGGTKSTERIDQAGSWRGRPMDFVTAYPAYGTWSDLTDPSSNMGLFAGFKGRIALGLPLLPTDRAGQWNDILSGAHDDVFRTIARDLETYGFADSAIRVGLEANGDWFPWAANASNAAQYKAAFRRVVQIMRAQDPQLTFWFDTGASANPLPGASGRLDVFRLLYPGDDVVDGISMDHYDFYSVVARNASEFAQAMRPPGGAGLADAADFARAHHKGFAVPEWGLHALQGAGDNPYFFTGMHQFFQQNKDVLVYEDYFNEGASYIQASIWDPDQNPQSSAVYRRLWGR